MAAHGQTLTPRTPFSPELGNDCDFRLRAKSVRRNEHHVQFPYGPDADVPPRLVAPAKEQLALIAEDRFHVIPFVEG